MLETLPEQQNVSGSIARKASNTVFKRTSRSQLAVCRIQLCLCSVMSCVHAHSSLLLMSRICSRPAPVRKWRTYRTVTACKTSSADAAEKYDWKLDRKPNPHTRGDLLEIPVTAIRRPLGRTRSNDQDKVQALMDSIQEVGLKEPIDILEVDGKYYGFSGCHRYEAFQRLGIEKIPCKVRKANQNTLKMHMM